jgi:GH15 family glucan-1,4-alpha-glucosidase
LVTDELARWIGLRYAVRLRRVLRPWVRRATWITTRDQAGRRVAAAWDPVRGLLPQSVGPSTPDAATLLAAIHECFGPDDPRAGRLVRSTIAALEEGPFLRRYPSGTDDFAGVEATFVPASWWAISALCAIGDLPAAEARADAMCARLPRLLPEEWDVVAEHGLGNAPLLWSHSQAARALYDLHALRIRRRFGRLGHATWRIGRFLRLRFSR